MSDKKEQESVTEPMCKEIKKLTEKDLKDLVYEMIKFCKDWNLWEGVKLFAAGKSYRPLYTWEDFESQEYPYDKKGFRDLEDVCICFQDDPEDYILSGSEFEMRGLPVPTEPDERRRYVNPELLSMTYDGALYGLLNDMGYSENLRDLPVASQKEVRENDKGYMDEVESLKEEEFIFYLPDGRESIVDPLDFDTYEEYLQAEEDAEDHFEKYAEWMLGSYHASLDFVLEKFDAIFEKYGIWYQPGFRWSLTTFYRSC